MEKLRPNSVDKLIENSGMITHHKVIKALRENGWSVLVAPYYYDNIANTIREIDVVAEKQFNSDSRAVNSSVQVNVQLFLECKYIKQEIVFWFDDKNVDNAVVKTEKETGLRILHGQRMSGDILPGIFHSLNNDKVAKLFSNNTNKEDVIYKAITQCLNSKIYYDQWFNKPISLEFNQHGKSSTLILKYPVIICDNFENFLKVDFENEKYSYDKIKDHFQLEINYTYLDKTKTQTVKEDFLIDVVDYNNLNDFLVKIEKEVNSIKKAKADVVEWP